MSQARTTTEHGWMPREALPADAIIRPDRAGEWVAWDHEMTRAVANGLDRETVRPATIVAGIVRPVCEWVPPTPIRPTDHAG